MRTGCYTPGAFARAARSRARAAATSLSSSCTFLSICFSLLSADDWWAQGNDSMRERERERASVSECVRACPSVQEATMAHARVRARARVCVYVCVCVCVCVCVYALMRSAGQELT
jgi:hypothetical protein